MRVCSGAIVFGGKGRGVGKGKVCACEGTVVSLDH